MYLDKEMGGVNMPNLRNILISKQIKVVYNILKSNYAHWNMIGKKTGYKILMNSKKTVSFYVSVQISKVRIFQTFQVLPRGYINSWAVFQSKIKVNDKTSIMDSNLFGNSNISIRNTPLFYQNFSKSNIRTIRDIWNINTKTFYDDTHINTILIDKSNWREKYSKIKRSIEEEEEEEVYLQIQ